MLRRLLLHKLLVARHVLGHVAQVELQLVHASTLGLQLCQTLLRGPPLLVQQLLCLRHLFARARDALLAAPGLSDGLVELLLQLHDVLLEIVRPLLGRKPCRQRLLQAGLAALALGPQHPQLLLEVGGAPLRLLHARPRVLDRGAEHLDLRGAAGLGLPQIALHTLQVPMQLPDLRVARRQVGGGRCLPQPEVLLGLTQLRLHLLHLAVLRADVLRLVLHAHTEIADERFLGRVLLARLHRGGPRALHRVLEVADGLPQARRVGLRLLHLLPQRRRLVRRPRHGLRPLGELGQRALRIAPRALEVQLHPLVACVRLLRLGAHALAEHDELLPEGLVVALEVLDLLISTGDISTQLIIGFLHLRKFLL
mmetsp:Transcript_76849/g.207384  ORF Transcript_76849/g.207384 Transcript_76849/m.207384 type:complete len:367 (+) Transcript_76849:1487-2587(+)